MISLVPRNASGRRILVVAAHPDDEVLGCGGTIARHSDAGDCVHVLIVAEGVTSRQLCRDRALAAKDLSDLSRSARLSADILGVSHIEILDYPDNRLDSLDRLDLVKVLESISFV